MFCECSVNDAPVKLYQGKWVFATNSNFVTSLSLQPDVEDLWYFKPRNLLDQKVFALSGCKDKVIRKFVFVSKTQFLCLDEAASLGIGKI